MKKVLRPVVMLVISVLFFSIPLIAEAGRALVLAAESSGGNITYQAHVSNIGWMDGVSGGQTAGTTGQNQKIEAIKVSGDLTKGSHIVCQGHVEDYGWMDKVQDGEICGTTGEDKRLEAIRIELTGPDAETYDIYYRTHVSDIGWLSWASNGGDSGSTGMMRQIEAIQIVIVPKTDPAPGSTARPFAYAGMDPVTIARAHVQNVGWTQGPLTGEIIGTVGLNQQLEALTLEFYDDSASGIDYKTHLRNIGWESDWRSDGQLSGTIGQDRPIECVRVKLSGIAAQKYDIYYQAHVENLGWLEWAKNGDPAGTTQAGLNLEALNIVLLPKDSPAPGPTDEAWRSPISPELLKARIHGCWLDTQRAAEEINSYVSGISDNYIYVGQNQTYNGFEGYYEVLSANSTGGRLKIVDYYSQKEHEIYVDFKDLPKDHLKLKIDGQEREFVLGDTTDGIHYTFSGYKQYGQLAVLALKNSP